MKAITALAGLALAAPLVIAAGTNAYFVADGLPPPFDPSAEMAILMIIAAAIGSTTFVSSFIKRGN